MEEKTTFIYGLFVEGESIRYVGKSDDIHKRLKKHIYKAKNHKENNSHKNCWIRKHLGLNDDIKVKLLEEVSYGEWQNKERYWIKKLKNNNLTNSTDGGECGVLLYKEPFDVIKKWVQGDTNVKTKSQWSNYIKENTLPNFIPTHPRQSYLNRGWVTWGDFLGTGKIQDNLLINYLTYEEAKRVVKKLNIKTMVEYRELAKKGLLPKTIPNRPRRYYNIKNRGWVSGGDYLGTGKVANQLKVFMSYGDFKQFIKNSNIKTMKQFKAYCVSGNRNDKIPTNPNNVYKNKGWVSWVDLYS